MASPLWVMLIAPARSYRLAAYCAAAEDLGIRLIVASVGVQPLVPASVVGIGIELEGNVDPGPALIDIAREHAVSGVVATDDATVELACQTARGIGLRHNPLEAIRASRRKDLARTALANWGAPTPAFWLIDLEAPIAPQLRRITFPCVVKPLALSGSCGVIRCDRVDQLEPTVRRVARIAAAGGTHEARSKVLVEAFLPGAEVALEGMLVRGALHVLAVFDKPDPLNGPYFEETYYVTPSRLDESSLAKVLARVQQAVNAYGLAEGPIHAELRVACGDATILEVAARTIGGDCARLLRFGAGQSLEQLVLLHAIGALEIPMTSANEAGGVLMLPIETAGILRRVEGVLEAGRVPGIEEVVIAVREGYELVPLPEGSSYLGFIFAQGADPHYVERALRDAHAKLRVITAPIWRIEAG